MIPNAMPAFDFGLGETADALRDQVQRFASAEVAPIAAELDKTDRFPRELWPRMGALGLHGITVSEEYGGSGLGYLEHVVAVEELSRAPLLFLHGPGEACAECDEARASLPPKSA